MPNRDPFIATAIREEIAELSQNEVDSLNRFLDNTIAIIDENNQLYDQYAGQWITLRERVSDLNDKVTDFREKRIRAKQLKEKGDQAVTAQEVIEKVNTISMSLNPVAAALQFAAKILKTELQHELKGLQDTAAIINPAIDNFTRFSGGVLLSTGQTIEGDLNRKIRELEERIEARKALRKKRIDKLFDRRKARRDRLATARAEVEAANQTQEEQEEQAQTNSEEKATESPVVVAPIDETPSDGDVQGPNQDVATLDPNADITPTNQLITPDSPPELVTTVVDSNLPQELPTNSTTGQTDVTPMVDAGEDGIVQVEELFPPTPEEQLDAMVLKLENGEITQEEFEQFLDNMED